MAKLKVTEGYEVVYDHKGITLHAGNPVVFPSKELAETYKENYVRFPWWSNELYIKGSSVALELEECRTHEGKTVYNRDWYFGPDSLKIGSLVEQNVVDDLVNCLPPACMRNDCTQHGEAFTHMNDLESNKCRPVYATFKCVAENIWEFCGYCFRGENVQRGTMPQYV